ncbi:MAG: hypothetical protein COW10_00230, partial [Candidatus Omnitrophica bacterium CG12_big_fil_rev_8_21_14_0_65_42_8]
HTVGAGVVSEIIA